MNGLFRLKLYIIVCLYANYTLAQVVTYSTTDKKAITLFEKGVDAYTNANYQGAESFYKRALERQKDFAEAIFRLGQVYDMTGRKTEAKIQYQESIRLEPDLPYIALSYYVIGIDMFNKGDYQKSINYLDKYLSFAPKAPNLVKNAKKSISNSSFALEALKNPLKIQPVSLGKNVNIFSSQYFPTLTGDKEQLIFTGYDRAGQDENLFISFFKNNTWTRPVSISNNINSKENEGTAAISADGRTLVFTACNKKDGYGSCDLYISYRTGNDWQKAENLGENINTREWESQPSLSADGSILYFVSDRRGGIGRRDIYMSKKDENGQFQKAQNLGADINTTDDEISPFIHPNGITLFFASNGYLGMGGMDLYFSDKINGKWAFPTNFGYPINTSRDQVSLFITADNKKGYYSLEQNQESENRNSLLYQFDLPLTLSKQFKKANIVKGKITDAKSKKKLSAEIEVFNLQNNQLETKTQSDELTGEYMNTINQGGSYSMVVSKPGYFFKSLNFDYSDEKDSTAQYIDIQLEPLIKNSKEVLNNIYFDTNKFELKEESKPGLEKLIKLLRLNPTLVVEISGHTDDIGKDNENIILSKNRANAVVNYLVKNGINRARIQSVGYGKTRPAVPNNSDENRSQNRRIEIKIL